MLEKIKQGLMPSSFGCAQEELSGSKEEMMGCVGEPRDDPTILSFAQLQDFTSSIVHVCPSYSTTIHTEVAPLMSQTFRTDYAQKSCNGIYN